MKKIFFVLWTLLITGCFSLAFAEGSSVYQSRYEKTDSSPHRPGRSGRPHGNELSPYSIKTLKTDRAEVEVRSSVSGAEVYINGNYKGTTPLLITGLKPGSYELSVEKKGYDPVFHKIRANKGTCRVYKVNLTRLKGYLSFENIPEGASVYIDGSAASITSNSLTEGSHKIKIRKFGYEDATGSVLIKPFQTTYISCNLVPADFRLTGFSSDRSRFNPSSNSDIGYCLLTAQVTASSTGSLKIRSPEGILVFQRDYSGFSSWNETTSWNGKNEYGEGLPAGAYTATFEAGGYSLSTVISIDYSVTYTLTDITFAGSGTGNLLTARVMPADTMTIGAFIGPEFHTVNGINGVPAGFNFSWAISDWCEISNILGFYFSQEASPFYLSGNIKFAGGPKITPDSSLLFAGSVSFNVSDGLLYYPGGPVQGTGIGMAAAAGIDSTHLYLGGSSQFFLSLEKELKDESEFSWQNGLSISIKPISSIGIDLFCSLISSFAGKNAQWFNSIQDGISFSMLIPNTTWKMSLSAGSILYLADLSAYINGKFSMCWIL